MAFNIERFKSVITNIARPTLFAVQISAGAKVVQDCWGTTDSNVTAGNMTPASILEFTCKASQLPSSTIGRIQVPFMGRKINFAGDVDYQDWQCTIIADRNYTIWRALYNWRQAWNRAIANIASGNQESYATRNQFSGGSYTSLAWNSTYGNMNNFKCDGKIIAYDNTGHANLVINCVGLFPYEVPVVQMSWENNDSTVDIDCTFMMDYFLVEKPDGTSSSNL